MVSDMLFVTLLVVQGIELQLRSFVIFFFSEVGLGKGMIRTVSDCKVQLFINISLSLSLYIYIYIYKCHCLIGLENGRSWVRIPLAPGFCQGRVILVT